MPIKRYVASADNTITDAFKENLSTRASASNMGNSEKSINLSIKNQIKDVVVEETINNINSSSCDCNSNIVNSDEFNEKLNKIYEKFSDNLVRKIKEASKNGKDEKAIEIINQIFLDD